MRFITTLDEPLLVRLKDVLKRGPSIKRFVQKKQVGLIFLHGSLAKDELKPLSDIDVAVLFLKDNYDYKQVYEMHSKLCEVIGREDVDLMILNKASPVACMQVLANGILFYSKNLRILKGFRLTTIQRYLATQHLRQSFNHYMQAAILGKG